MNGRVIGTRWDYGDARKHFPKAHGRFLNPNDEEEKRRVVFLGNEMARDIFGPEDQPGGSQHRENATDEDQHLAAPSP